MQTDALPSTDAPNNKTTAMHVQAAVALTTASRTALPVTTGHHAQVPNTFAHRIQTAGLLHRIRADLATAAEAIVPLQTIAAEATALHQAAVPQEDPLTREEAMAVAEVQEAEAAATAVAAAEAEAEEEDKVS